MRSCSSRRGGSSARPAHRRRQRAPARPAPPARRRASGRSRSAPRRRAPAAGDRSGGAAPPSPGRGARARHAGRAAPRRASSASAARRTARRHLGHRRQAMQQRLQIEPGAADHDRQPAGGDARRDRLARRAASQRPAEAGSAAAEDAVQPVRHARLVGGVGPRRQQRQLAVELHAVGVDDHAVARARRAAARAPTCRSPTGRRSRPDRSSPGSRRRPADGRAMTGAVVCLIADPARAPLEPGAGRGARARARRRAALARRGRGVRVRGRGRSRRRRSARASGRRSPARRSTSRWCRRSRARSACW